MRSGSVGIHFDAGAFYFPTLNKTANEARVIITNDASSIKTGGWQAVGQFKVSSNDEVYLMRNARVIEHPADYDEAPDLELWGDDYYVYASPSGGIPQVRIIVPN